MTRQSSSSPGPEDSCNQEALALKEAGNDLFRQRRVEDAVAKYQEALQSALAAADHLPAVLMQNIAAASLQKDDPMTALTHAGAVLAFPRHESCLKAHYRAAKAAEGMNVRVAALWPLNNVPPCTSKSIKDSKMHKELAQLNAKLRGCRLKSVEKEMLERRSEYCLFTASLLQCTVAMGKLRNSSDKLQPPATKDETQKHALSLKREGNDAFARKDFATAIVKWREALSVFTLVPMICSNLAAAYFKLEKREETIHAASAVLVFQPYNVKALIRAGTAAIERGQSELARDCAELGLSHEPGHKELRKLHRAALAAIGEDAHSGGHSKEGGGRAGAATAGSTMTEGQLHELETAGHAAPEHLEIMRNMFNMLQKDQPQVVRNFERVAGPMPEEFEKVFMAERNLPPGCNKAAVTKILAKGSAEAFGMWTSHAYKLKKDNGDNQLGDEADRAGDPCHEVSTGYIIKRLGSMEQDRWDWFHESPIGDISFRTHRPYQNNTLYLASFSNVAQHPLPLQLQELSKESKVNTHTHVDVGFLDLGVLCETLADQHRQLADSAESSTTQPADATGGSLWGSSGLKLRWVGIEESAFCCAKALVIIEMIRQGCAAENIVQVWYSVGWTQSALADFHSSVAALLQRKDALTGQTTSIKEWILVWNGDQVPLKKARAEWLDRRKHSLAGISVCLRKNDRMAACYYSVSGDVVPLSAPYDGVSKNSDVEKVSTGSVVMFGARPHSSKLANYAINEEFLFTVPPEVLVKERLQGGHFFSAGAVIMKRRVEALAAALNANILSIEVRHGTVSASNLEEVQYIRSLEPDSMGWSNVCDYCAPQAFHKIAHMCGKRSTQHFMHTMNWMLDTKGAFILDYGSSEQCANLGEAGKPGKGKGARGQELKKQRNVRLEIRQEAQSAVKSNIKSQRADKLLRVPPLDNRMNVCDSLLALRMLPKWLHEFAHAASGSAIGCTARCELLHEPAYWPFTRTCGVGHFMMQYQEL